MSTELAYRQQRATLESAAELKFWSWRHGVISRRVESMAYEEVLVGFGQAKDEYRDLGGRLIDGRDGEAVYRANREGHMIRWCVTSNSPYGNLGASACVLPDGFGASRRNLQEVLYKLEQLQVWEHRVDIQIALDQIVDKYPPDELLYGIGLVEVEGFVSEVNHD